MAANISELQERLGYCFQNTELLVRALSHKSYVNENDGSLANYENYEFLGDAIIDFVISDIIVRIHKDWNEGELSKLRGNLVDSNNLAATARLLGLGKYILLGVGEEKTGGRNRSSLLADVLEAVIAAIYLDSGINSVRKVIKLLFMESIRSAERHGVDEKNYKSRLQETIQNRGERLSRYVVEKELGPDHSKEFIVSITVDEMRYCGKGKSKQSAEQDAARLALEDIEKKS